MKKWTAFLAAMIFSSSLALASGGWVGPANVNQVGLISTSVGDLCYVDLNGYGGYVFPVNNESSQMKCEIIKTARANGDQINIYQDNTIYISFTWTSGPSASYQEALSITY